MANRRVGGVRRSAAGFRRAYAYPLVRWGDIGATLIFAASMFAMLRWPERIQTIAAGSMIAVAAYMIVRGLSG